MAAARGEEDDEQRSHLTVGVVGQLSTEGNDFARDYLATAGDDIEVLSVAIPACALTGQDYPELPAWRAALAAPRRAYHPPEPPTAVRRGPPPITRDDARVGRNDPCPCGSGKKYKKCCLPHSTG
ncbi:SEC-C domain-containing protein [bacterium]|nr:SEC-C domain-containing protein [bacterium]